MEVAKAKLEKEKVFILQKVMDFTFCVIGDRTKENGLGRMTRRLDRSMIFLMRFWGKASLYRGSRAKDHRQHVAYDDGSSLENMSLSRGTWIVLKLVSNPGVLP